MNTNAKFKRKSIQIEAYAAPTPYLDPAGVAEKTLIKIRSDREARIAVAAMKKADKIAAEKKKKKSSVCNILQYTLIYWPSNEKVDDSPSLIISLSQPFLNPWLLVTQCKGANFSLKI